MARKSDSSPTGSDLSPEILRCLWASDYQGYSGDVADLYKAASDLLGREVTEDLLNLQVRADISVMVQDAYWASVS